MARRPPHLALNPPYVCFVFWFFAFPFFAKKTVFTTSKGNFCLLLSVPLCFSLAFFGLTLFQFLFLCLSLVLFFDSSFLSFFFAFFWFLVFSLYFIFCLLCFVSWKKATSKYSIAKFFFINPLSFLFPVVVSPLNPFLSSLFFFPDFQLCFCSTSMLLVSKTEVEKHQFWVKRGVATTFIFHLCFVKSEKLSFFGHVFGKFWLMLKKNTKKNVFRHIYKRKKQNDHF